MRVMDLKIISLQGDSDCTQADSRWFSMVFEDMVIGKDMMYQYLATADTFGSFDPFDNSSLVVKLFSTKY